MLMRTIPIGTDQHPVRLPGLARDRATPSG